MSTYKQSVFGEIPNTWDVIEADKYCEKVTDGTHDSPKQTAEGYPLITSRHIKGHKIDFDNAYLISKEDYDHINKRSYVSQWDVIISMIGEYCGFTYLEEKSDINYAIKNVGLFKTGDELKSKWLYYFFQSKYTNHLLHTYRSGTSQPYLALGVLRKFPILIPQNHEEKESIVAILDSLRKKIKLLQAQNKTLEAMAQTIFKEWFGKYQIGDDLPEGWRVGKLGDVIDLQSGFSHNTKVSGGTKVKIAKMGVVDGKNFFNRRSVINYSETIDSKYKLKEDDIIVSTRDVTRDKLIIGNVSLIPDDLANFGLYAGSNTWIIKTDLNQYYLFLLLRNRNFRHHIIQSSKGSTIVMITRDAFLNCPLIFPHENVLLDFINTIDPIFKKIKNNNSTIQSLTKTRDTLLPKLMSGQVRVNNIKQTADA